MSVEIHSSYRSHNSVTMVISLTSCDLMRGVVATHPVPSKGCRCQWEGGWGLTGEGWNECLSKINKNEVS